VLTAFGVFFFLRSTEVILFFVGGYTYEEAAVVAKLNSGNAKGCNYLLGGTSALNPYSYEDLICFYRPLANLFGLQIGS